MKVKISYYFTIGLVCTLSLISCETKKYCEEGVLITCLLDLDEKIGKEQSYDFIDFESKYDLYLKMDSLCITLDYYPELNCFLNQKKIKKEEISLTVFKIIKQVHYDSKMSVDEMDEEILKKIIYYEISKIICKRERILNNIEEFQSIQIKNKIKINLPTSYTSNYKNASSLQCPNDWYDIKDKNNLKMVALVVDKDSSDIEQLKVKLIVLGLSTENFSILGTPINENDTIFFDMSISHYIEKLDSAR